MTNAPSNTLALAGTGKTGSRVAAKLTKLGLSVRTAARNGADVRFDWAFYAWVVSDDGSTGQRNYTGTQETVCVTTPTN